MSLVIRCTTNIHNIIALSVRIHIFSKSISTHQQLRWPVLCVLRRLLFSNFTRGHKCNNAINMAFVDPNTVSTNKLFTLNQECALRKKKKKVNFQKSSDQLENSSNASYLRSQTLRRLSVPLEARMVSLWGDHWTCQEHQHYYYNMLCLHSLRIVTL